MLSGPYSWTMTEPTDGQRISRLVLAALLIGAGVTHFVKPEFFDDIVPEWMVGDPRTVTYVSGIAELAVGSLLLTRRSARVGGWAALALFIVVYPANVQMAIDTGVPEDATDWVVWARLPLQFPLFVWAFRVGRRSSATLSGPV